MIMCMSYFVGSALQLVYFSREAGGNPRSTAVHAKVDEAASLMNQTVAKLTSTLEKAAEEAETISGKEVVDTTKLGSVRILSCNFVAHNFTKSKRLFW